MSFYKLILTIFTLISLSFVSLPVAAQTLPFANNTNEKDRIESLIYTNYIGKYDQLIYFTASSYWSRNKADFFAYGLRKDEWEKVAIQFKKRKDEAWSKPNLKKMKCDTVVLNKLLAFLDTNGFWLLDRDSLNIKNRLLPDGNTITYGLSDGRYYEFGLINYYGYLKIPAYEPDYMLKQMPEIKQREVFIRCREEFLKTWKEK